jgi:hypothetical protein
MVPGVVLLAVPLPGRQRSWSLHQDLHLEPQMMHIPEKLSRFHLSSFQSSLQSRISHFLTVPRIEVFGDQAARQVLWLRLTQCLRSLPISRAILGTGSLCADGD